MSKENSCFLLTFRCVLGPSVIPRKLFIIPTNFVGELKHKAASKNTFRQVILQKWNELDQYFLYWTLYFDLDKDTIYVICMNKLHQFYFRWDEVSLKRTMEDNRSAMQWDFQLSQFAFFLQILHRIWKKVCMLYTTLNNIVIPEGSDRGSYARPKMIRINYRKFN